MLIFKRLFCRIKKLHLHMLVQSSVQAEHFSFHLMGHTISTVGKHTLHINFILLLCNKKIPRAHTRGFTQL